MDESCSDTALPSYPSRRCRPPAAGFFDFGSSSTLDSYGETLVSALLGAHSVGSATAQRGMVNEGQAAQPAA